MLLILLNGEQINCKQSILTRRGSITVRVTSCLGGLDLTKQVNLLLFSISKSAE